jgi:two-component system sensor histidine kinase and response regulator WspE
VGLDVVLTAIQEIRGNIRTQSTLDEGTSINLELPLTLSILRCLLATINDELYGFPLARIDKVIQVDTSDISSIENHQYINDGDERIALVDAGTILQLSSQSEATDQLHIIVVGDRTSRYGLVVDRFNGENQLAIRALPGVLGKIRDVGSTALTDKGETVLIIDVDDILKTIHDSLEGKSAETRLFAVTEKTSFAENIKRVLVVDDSLTVREVEKKLLESRGYLVDVAVDGIDGLNNVRSSNYDLVISDIDMPRMNGIELVSSIRSDNRIKDIPVMIVSYKDRPEDRKRGLEAGADYYLTKGSFHDESLLDAVIDLIGVAES